MYTTIPKYDPVLPIHVFISSYFRSHDYSHVELDELDSESKKHLLQCGAMDLVMRSAVGTQHLIVLVCGSFGQEPAILPP